MVIDFIAQASTDSDAISWMKTILAIAGPLIAVAIALRKSGHKSGVDATVTKQMQDEIAVIKTSLEKVKSDLLTVKAMDEQSAAASKMDIAKLDATLARLSDNFQLLSNGFEDVRLNQKDHLERIAATEQLAVQFDALRVDIHKLSDNVTDLVREVGRLDGRTAGRGR